jgi:hypothetical protein
MSNGVLLHTVGHAKRTDREVLGGDVEMLRLLAAAYTPATEMMWSDLDRLACAAVSGELARRLLGMAEAAEAATHARPWYGPDRRRRPRVRTWPPVPDLP